MAVRLRRDTAPAHVGDDVVLSPRVGDLERLVHDHARRLAPEVVFEGALG